MISHPLTILHVGSGFRPWRRGGLVAYVEDLIGEQQRRGHRVAYLYAGRLYPYGRSPRLRRGERDGVPMLEIVNSPIHDHGRQPELEISEPRIERIVEDVVRELAPDVVQVHELCGMPSSILDVAGCTGAPVVFTLQDYFALCPTFKLLDGKGRVCLKHEIGADCVATIAAMPRDPALLYSATAKDATSSSLLQGAFIKASRRRIGPTAARSPQLYQRRRDINVERLNRVDRLIAMSRRVAEIHVELGVDPGRLQTMQLTLAHIEHLVPRTTRPPGPLTFATLGGGESDAKGGRILLDAWRGLAAKARAGSVQLLLCGHVARRFAREAESIPGIVLPGSFAPSELDALLDRVDVGIVPSVWEEAYGYVGMEFLAKGIPVVANAIGGMPDYVQDGRTGWLNPTCDASGLEAILHSIAARPEAVFELSARIASRRDEIVLSLAAHAARLEEVYRSAIAERAIL